MYICTCIKPAKLELNQGMALRIVKLHVHFVATQSKLIYLVEQQYYMYMYLSEEYPQFNAVRYYM